MRSHCRGCCWRVSHKAFHSMWNVTFGHDERKKNGEKSEWLYGLLNPKSNIIVRAPLLSSGHQILLLVLIENPWGPSWKQYSALEKMIQKMSLSFLSKCCVWGLQHLDSQFNYFSWKGRERLERVHRQSRLFEMTVTTAVTKDFKRPSELF